MTKELKRFEQWWDAENDIPNDGPYTPDTPIQFAWAAWQAALAQQNEFKPDWDTQAVLVEEMQRMAKRIEDLEAMLERQTARIVDLQTHIENLEGEA